MRLDSQKLRTIRILLCVSLLIISVAFAVLSVMSATNWRDVVYTKLAVSLNADTSIKPSGLGQHGELQDSSIIWFNSTVDVTNPGSKTIRFQYVKFQGWVRDYLSEDLLNSSGKIFFSALVRDFSNLTSGGLVAPQTVKSFHISWRLDNNEPMKFQETKRILNYAMTNSSPLVPWDQVEWNQFYVFQLIVTGVPIDYYGPNSGYLIELPVILRYQGSNLGSG